MSISVSTIMYKPYELDSVWPLLEAVDDEKVGIEVFPFHHLTYFEKVLERNMPRLKDRPITVHCPYFSTDTCFAEGTVEYALNMEYYEKVFEIAQKLNAEYVVHHFYNFHFAAEEREEKKKIAMENLPRIKELAKKYGVTLALENTETMQDPAENMFTQEEFISTVRAQEDCKVLIDIGHVSCAGWNLSEVIYELKDKIVGYHLHNNDGSRDSHKRIFDGVLDMEQFVRDVQEYTPNADFTIEYEMSFNAIEGVCEDIAFLKKAGLG